MKSLLRPLLRIADTEISFVRRGFRGGDPRAVANVEAVGAAFLAGYHTALQAASVSDAIQQLESTDAAMRGFRYEGAAMSLYLLDRLLPGRRDRFDTFLSTRGADHIYMAYVGAGWAHARLPFGLRGALARRDPLLRWLMLDGYGFHQGFFHWHSSVDGRQQVPARVQGYARRAFDQGLGRSLWFVEGHDPERITATLARFAPQRRADLWAGVGLAATYAGGVERGALEQLRTLAGADAAWLAQGSAFGAAARNHAGNLVPHNDLACEVFCRMPAADAAARVDEVRTLLPADRPDQPAYELWRQRTRDAVHGGAPGEAAVATPGIQAGPQAQLLHTGAR
jgi:enediyne biosynthesis protein E3